MISNNQKQQSLCESQSSTPYYADDREMFSIEDLSVNEDMSCNEPNEDAPEKNLRFEFNAKNFYWLFNPIMKFNKRRAFCVDDEVKTEDFLKMTKINRQTLRSFVRKSKLASPSKTAVDSFSLSNNGFLSSASVSPDKISIKLPKAIDLEMNDETTSEEVKFDDVLLDIELKTLLQNYENGEMIPQDIIAHIEFFYNTRSMRHDSENPFDCVSQFPALLYKTYNSNETLYEIHKRITFPRQKILRIELPGDDVSMTSSQVSLVSPIDKRYDWYPNRDISSPVSQFAKSPSPVKVSYKDFRRGTMIPGLM